MGLFQEPPLQHGGVEWNPLERFTPAPRYIMLSKYGALSDAAGTIHLTWAVGRHSTPPRLKMRWTESGGPPVEPPSRRGFGTRLIERCLAQDFGGEARIEFASTGVVCTVDAPMA
jgi:two-component sensor histidine kinase